MLRESVFGNSETITECIVSLYSKLDVATARHQYRVSKIAVLIAELLGMSRDRMALVETSAIIHDIGKLRVPVAILQKHSKINDDESKLIRRHPITGYYLLVDLGCPLHVADIILQHHERLDGSGYPLGLKDGQISFESQLVAVADVIDSLKYGSRTSTGYNTLEILSELSRNAGILYNTEVVEAVMHNMPTIDSTYRTYIINRFARAMMQDQISENVANYI